MHFIMNNKVLLHFGRSATKRRDKTFAAQINNGSHVDSFFVVAVGGICVCVCVCVCVFLFFFSLWGIYSETYVTGDGGQIQTQKKCLTIYSCCEDSTWQRGDFLELVAETALHRHWVMKH